jgi:hypothetical protein
MFFQLATITLATVGKMTLLPRPSLVSASIPHHPNIQVVGEFIRELSVRFHLRTVNDN